MYLCTEKPRYNAIQGVDMDLSSRKVCVIRVFWQKKRERERKSIYIRFVQRKSVILDYWTFFDLLYVIKNSSLCTEIGSKYKVLGKEGIGEYWQRIEIASTASLHNNTCRQLEGYISITVIITFSCGTDCKYVFFLYFHYKTWYMRILIEV